MATEGAKKADGKFRHRGVSFKVNEIVNIVAGTAAGVPGKKQRQFEHVLKVKQKVLLFASP